MKQIDLVKNLVFTNKMSTDELADAVHSVGHAGYFSDTPDFKEYEYGRLYSVTVREDPGLFPYTIIRGDGETEYYKYFVDECDAFFFDESEYRPIKTTNDLAIKVGDVVTYRHKDVPNLIHTVILSRMTYHEHDKTIQMIRLGDDAVFDLQNLHKNYEIKDPITNEWHPFGVKV